MSALAPTTQNGIVTDVPKDFVRQWWKHIDGSIPQEKVKCELNQQMLARVMAAQGSTQVEGLGQQAARIDARLFFRLQQQHGNAVHEWLPEYLKDNPHLCSKGYRPKVDPRRKGLTGGWYPKNAA